MAGCSARGWEGRARAALPPDQQPGALTSEGILRLVTWNCYCGDVSRRLSHLAPLSADLVVLQEVAQTGRPFHDHPVHWCGTNSRKGVAITSCSPAFTIAPVEAPPDMAPRTAAVTVHGPTPFLLVAMWAHPVPNYADNAIAVVRAWQARASGLPLVVAGDFNVDLGSAVQTAKHRRLAQFLHEECGLVSAYHAHRNLRYGHRAEVRTYRHLRRRRCHGTSTIASCRRRGGSE